MMKKRGKWLPLAISIIILILIYLQGEMKEKKRANEILKNPEIGIGKVYSIKIIDKRGYKIAYEFNYDNKIYSNFSVDTYDYIRDKVVGKTFPVIFNKMHPDKCDILIFKRDFKRFNLSYPDSLSWVPN